MHRSTRDRLTLNLIARSHRVQREWLDALPDWRDHVYPDKTLVDALVAADVLHAPATVIIDLAAAGTLKADHLPVLITAWGCDRLQSVLDAYAKDEVGLTAKPVDYDRFASGDFIQLGNEEDASEETPEYDAIGAGEFIAFVDDDDDAEDADSVSAQPATEPDRKSVVNAARPDWDSFDSGDFIAFDSTP